MKIIFNNKKKRLSANNGVFGLTSSKDNYNEVVLAGLFKKIFKKLNLFDFVVTTTNSITNGTTLYFLNNQLPIAYAELFKNGFLLFTLNESGKLTFWQKKECTFGGNGVYKSPYGDICDIFYSDTYLIFGRSDYDLSLDLLKSIDTVLNGATTVIKRLGVFVVGAPEQPQQNPQTVILDDEEREELEKNVIKDYGMLSEQKQFMFLRRPLKLTRVALGGKDLMLTETLEMLIKILADVVEIPYDCVALSGKSTFANQEQAEQALQDSAEAFVSKIWSYLNKMNINFNWTVNNNKYGKNN